MDNTDVRPSSFKGAFSRPIIGYIWICWLAVVAALIGASDFRYVPIPDDQRISGYPRGYLLWVGIVWLLLGLGRVVFLLSRPDSRKWLLTPTAQRVKGHLPIMVWMVAFIGAVAVVVVWI